MDRNPRVGMKGSRGGHCIAEEDKGKKGKGWAAWDRNAPERDGPNGIGRAAEERKVQHGKAG